MTPDERFALLVHELAHALADLSAGARSVRIHATSHRSMQADADWNGMLDESSLHGLRTRLVTLCAGSAVDHLLAHRDATGRIEARHMVDFIRGRGLLEAIAPHTEEGGIRADADTAAALLNMFPQELQPNHVAIAREAGRFAANVLRAAKFAPVVALARDILDGGREIRLSSVPHLMATMKGQQYHADGAASKSARVAPGKTNFLPREQPHREKEDTRPSAGNRTIDAGRIGPEACYSER